MKNKGYFHQIASYAIFWYDIGMTFEELSEKIRNIQPKHSQLLIGIDGGGGAGKTTLANKLAEVLGATIIRLDDLYKTKKDRAHEKQNSDINVDFDWERIEKEIFIPIKNNTPITYQFYDWSKDAITHTIDVPVDKPIIIEGGYSLQSKFFNEYDFTVFVEAPEDLRLQRALVRDGEHMRPYWETTWLPADKRYKETQQPHLKADLIVSGSKSDFPNNLIVVES